MNDPNAFRGPNYPPQDPAYPYAYGAQFPPPVYTPPSSPLSIASLICGILAWTVVPFLCAIVAIITGHMALGEIRRDPQRVGGRGLAVVGLVLGYVQMVLVLIGIGLVILFAAFVVSASPAIRQTVQVTAPAAASKTIPAEGDDIDRRVTAIVATISKRPAETIDPIDSLKDLEIEDTDRIDLIVRLEQEFRVKLRPGESQSWKTVADVARSIRDRYQPPAPAKAETPTEPAPEPERAP